MKRSGKDQSVLQTFENLLLESIDEALSSLGESNKTSIYSYVERKLGIMRGEIPTRLEDFSEALEKIFGLAARHLEVLMVKNLHANTKINCEIVVSDSFGHDLAFVSYTKQIRLAYKNSGEYEDVEVIVPSGEKPYQYEH